MKKKYKEVIETLQLIRDLAYDYDGCNTIETIKELVDELGNLAATAIMQIKEIWR